MGGYVLVVYTMVAAMAGSLQRNYRLPVALLERFEGFVPRRERSARVRVALEEWLDRAGAPVPGPPAAAVAVSEWAAVLNPAGDGTLLRVDRPDLFEVGGFVQSRAFEVMRVRGIDDGLLVVDRGQRGSGVVPLRVGDELAPYETSEASPAVLHLPPALGADPAGRSDASVSGPGSADGSDGANGVTEAVAAADAPPPCPEPGGVDAVSAPAAHEGGQARARVAPAPPDTSDYAGNGVDPVDLAVDLAVKTGDPAAVWRARIREGRVSLAGRPFRSGIVDRGQLEFVELDGERVL